MTGWVFAAGGDAEATEGETIGFDMDKPKIPGLDVTVGTPVRYSYTTKDGSATAGSDYQSVNGN